MADAYGYSPREVDRLQLRDLAVMLRGAVQRHQRQWQQAAVVATMTYNMGGPRTEDFTAKDPDELFPSFYGKDDEEWEEEVADQFARYNPD